MTEKKLEELSFEELEGEIYLVLEKLSDTSLPLDESASLYKYGKSIIAEMRNRIEKLQKETQDLVEE